MSTPSRNPTKFVSPLVSQEPLGVDSLVNGVMVVVVSDSSSFGKDESLPFMKLLDDAKAVGIIFVSLDGVDGLVDDDDDDTVLAVVVSGNRGMAIMVAFLRRDHLRFWLGAWDGDDKVDDDASARAFNSRSFRLASTNRAVSRRSVALVRTPRCAAKCCWSSLKSTSSICTVVDADAFELVLD